MKQFLLQTTNQQCKKLIHAMCVAFEYQTLWINFLNSKKSHFITKCIFILTSSSTFTPLSSIIMQMYNFGLLYSQSVIRLSVHMHGVLNCVFFFLTADGTHEIFRIVFYWIRRYVSNFSSTAYAIECTVRWKFHLNKLNTFTQITPIVKQTGKLVSTKTAKVIDDLVYRYILDLSSTHKTNKELA